MNIEGKVGPQTIQDGSLSQPRLSKDGSVVSVDGHARYQEAAYRGNVYHLSTAAAGVTVAAANVFSASAGQPIVGILNPANSGKVAVILRAMAQFASGTAAAGGLVWGFLPPTVTGGLAVTAAGTPAGVNAATLATGQHAVKTFVNAALTGGGAGGLLRFIGGPTTGALAANANVTLQEETAGDIFCPPGCMVGIFATAAGTSPIVVASMSWEEIAA